MRLALVLFPVAIVAYFGAQDLPSLVLQPSIRHFIGNGGWHIVSDGWLNYAPFALPFVAGSLIGWKCPRRGGLGTLVGILLLLAIGLPIFARNFQAATEGYHPHGWRAGENYHAFSAAPVLFEPGLVICLVVGSISAAMAGKIKNRTQRRVAGI